MAADKEVSSCEVAEGDLEVAGFLVALAGFFSGFLMHDKIKAQSGKHHNVLPDELLKIQVRCTVGVSLVLPLVHRPVHALGEQLDRVHIRSFADDKLIRLIDISIQITPY